MFAQLIGAAIGGLIGAVISTNIEKSNRLNIELRYREDLDGWLLEIKSEKMLKEDIYVIHARNNDNSFLKSNIPLFADDDGSFILVAKKNNETTEVYLPFGCIYSYEEANLKISVKGLREKNNNYDLIGEDYFDLNFPIKKFCMSKLWRPLVGMCMAVARADNTLTSKEVRFVKDFIINTCDVPESELGSLKKLIKTDSQYSLNDYILMMKYRFPNISKKYVLEILSEIAIVNGGANKSKIDTLNTIVKHYKVSECEWKKIVEKYNLNAFEIIEKYLSMLGLRGKPNVRDINRAYKVKIKDCHPDKHQRASSEIIQKMHIKSVELTKARDALLIYFQ